MIEPVDPGSPTEIDGIVPEAGNGGRMIARHRAASSLRTKVRVAPWIAAVVLGLLLAPWAASEERHIRLDDGREVILYDDFTWRYYERPSAEANYSSIKDNQIPEYLRQGISADRATIIAAIEMRSQGWRYTMPRPKSAQAAWGNSDGRTTWWYGYWLNVETQEVSEKTPVKRSNGLYNGDRQDKRNTWRNGGSPVVPTKIEWLLSDSGGVAPR